MERSSRISHRGRQQTHRYYIGSHISMLQQGPEFILRKWYSKRDSFVLLPLTCRILCLAVLVKLVTLIPIPHLIVVIWSVPCPVCNPKLRKCSQDPATDHILSQLNCVHASFFHILFNIMPSMLGAPKCYLRFAFIGDRRDTCPDRLIFVNVIM